MAYLPTPFLLRHAVAGLTLLFSAGSCTQRSPSPSTATVASVPVNAEARDFAQYTALQWSDEFDGPTVDPAKWIYEVKDAWYNNELEATTNRLANVRVASGSLYITALKEAYNGRAYSSGRITTKGKQDFNFGRLDVRAKLPAGQGLWPAIWMLGTNDTEAGWPACGEIDIMELRGSAPTINNSTVHFGADAASHQYKGTQYTLPAGASGDFSTDFHVFSCVRSLNQVRFYVDGALYYTITPADASPYPFNNAFYTILNVAVGGDFGGNPTASTVFPQAMEVDYVRYYQYK